MANQVNPNRKKHPSPFTGILKVLSGLIIVPAALILIIYATIIYYKSAYKNEQKLLVKELSEVKIISDEEIKQEAAKSAKMEYPVKPPSKTPDQITREAHETARKLTDEKFNQKNIALQIDDAIKSFNEASVGQQVEFLSKNRSGPVKGTYKGKDGIFVLVDMDKYSMRDIYDEFKYLFDSDAATFKTQEKIKQIKGSYKVEADKFYEENWKRIEQELYAKSGYVKSDGGSWRAKSDIFNEAYASLKSQKASSRMDEIRRIAEKHKVFGFIKVEPEASIAEEKK
ncbi:MAG TPA: hypothetical protein DCZ94_08550 [Lentisphaeria bacterium]|nr:MAG: hypothetical protein A2X48_16285 [Lentisphaerae bacterium GWF2_49_21]HBC86988.1 hypothetical protein [Lentisphaeria bacterium]